MAGIPYQGAESESPGNNQHHRPQHHNNTTSNSATASAEVDHANATNSSFEDSPILSSSSVGGHGGQDDPLSQFDGLENFSVDDFLSFPSGSGSPQHNHHRESPESWRVHHPGVHMHLQNNAKLPTFNLVVNRSAVRTRSDSVGGESSNSSRTGSMYHAAKRQDETGFSKLPPALSSRGPSKLAPEAFLSRSGRHVDFSSGGSGRKYSFGTGASSTMDPLDALLAADLKDFDPTPLSEIKRRHETYQAQHSNERQSLGQSNSYESASVVPDAVTNPLANSNTNRTSNHIQQQLPSAQPNRVPISKQTPSRGSYSVRAVPLPIPTKKISPPGSPKKNGMHAPPSDSTSTAASSTHTASHLSSTQNTMVRAGQQSTNVSLLTKGKYGAYRDAPAPAIHHASNQKAKYGFGSKHTVPSIPPMMGSQHSRKRKPSPTTSTPGVSIYTSSPSQNATGVASASSGSYLGNSAAARAAAAAAADPGANNQGAAYERKKQRAKDARVKLNEAIERLSVAIGLAGTQSRERLDQWGALASSNLAGRQVGLDICSECVGTAESAKKWDRPSFVGSAASLIQQLNGQCEALMRELVTLYQQHESDLGRAVHLPPPEHQQQSIQEEPHREFNGHSRIENASTTMPDESGVPVENGEVSENLVPDSVNSFELKHVATSEPPVEQCHDTNSGATQHDLVAAPSPAAFSNEHHEMTQEVINVESENHHIKRQRVEHVEHLIDGTHSNDVTHNDQNGAHVGPPLQQLSVHEAAFREPKIMLRIASYLDPLSLCMGLRVSKGFHSMDVFSNEQVWQDLAAARFGFFNVRQWHAKLDDEDLGVSAPSATLYRSMDRANVMPPFSHEGMFLLGEARLPNKVSAWTFLVERSNGETLRSIRRRPDLPGKGEYTSLPVVELRTVIQNTGCSSRNHETIAIRDQTFSVDASTRRRGEEMKEVDWDDRFHKRLENLDGSLYHLPSRQPQRFCPNRNPDLAQLRLFDTVVIVSYIYARGCSTNSKFVQRSNFSKVLIGLTTGVTVPLVIPFPRDASHLQH